VKQNLDSIISFVDFNPQYNNYYLMLREMRQDVITEEQKQKDVHFLNKISVTLCRLPKMFLRLIPKLIFLHFMTSKFIL
jgi:hypothetical protein